MATSASPSVPDLTLRATGASAVEPPKPTGPTRRTVLQGAAAVLAGVGATSLLPPSLARALQSPAPSGDLTSIQHLVLLMQENRSFDHYFGTLNGVRGYGDPTALPRRGGGSVFAQPVKGSAHVPPAATDVRPFKVRDALNADSNNIQYIDSLPHTFVDGIPAWARGWWDGWIPAKGVATMSGYDREDIPFQFALADTFTVCDQYFASMMAGTSPNRNYWVSGYSGFEPLTGKRATDNSAYDEDKHPGYDWVTHAELLQDAGVSWKVYMEWDNYGDNNLEYFATFKDIMRRALAPVDGGQHQNCTSFYSALAKRPAAEAKRLLAELDASVEKLPARDRDLFNRGLRRSLPGTLVEEFRRDAEAGTLPTVCYIVPSSADSEHPSPSSPIQSAHITYGLLEVLGDHPRIWKKSALVYTFDEFDGYYDHVAPPVAPREHDDEWTAEGDPVGMGARVPTIVISPWTVGGHVCSEVFDHTSNIMLTERVTGVKTPMISPWRRQVAGDMTSTFDFSGGQTFTAVDAPGKVPAFTGRWKPQPGAFAPITVEEGCRPARALPYQLSAELHHRGDALTVCLRNDGEQAAPMAVYGFAGETKEPAHRVVKGVSEVAVSPQGKTYHLVATGPNGFRCDFAGQAAGDGVRVNVRVDASRRLSFRVTSTLDEDVVVRFNDTPVTVGAGSLAHHDVNAADADGWYGVTVTMDGNAAFSQRYYGHLENGRPSVTGPQHTELTV